MTITQLEYLIAVDTYKSFVEAALHCYVTQPTLSMQIQKLEEELQVLIFDRGKKPVLTTDIGRKIIDQAKIIVRESHRVSDIIKTEKIDMTGELRIGIIPTISPYLVPLFIANLNKKLPKVNIYVEELLSDQIMTLLHNDKLDVGIMVYNGHKDFIKKTLYFEEFMVYVSPQHKYYNKSEVEIENLDVHDLWMLKDGHCFRDQIEELCSERIDESKYKKIKFNGGSLETLKRMVDQGYGYTLLPELAYIEADTSQKKNFKQFKGKKKPLREVSFVLHRNYLKENLLDILHEEILRTLPEEMKNPDRGHVLGWNSKSRASAN